MTFIVTAVLVLLVAAWAANWLVKALGISLGSSAAIGKAKRRMQKVGLIAVAALFIIGLIAEYVTPAIIGAIETAANGLTATANGVADGTRTAAHWTVEAVPVIIGLGLALAYWTAASKWIDAPKARWDRHLRSIAVGAVFLPLMAGYMWLFIA